MINFEEFEEEIQTIWNSENNCSEDEPRCIKNIPKESLLFIGINPSRYSKTEKGTNVSWFTHEQIKPNSVNKNPFWSNFFRIAKEAGIEDNQVAHIDLLFIQETDQEKIRKMAYTKDKGTTFIYEQLKVSEKMIIKANPKLIVVANKFAAELMGKNKANGEREWMNLAFEDKNNGSDENVLYWRNIPVIFTSFFRYMKNDKKNELAKKIKALWNNEL